MTIASPAPALWRSRATWFSVAWLVGGLSVIAWLVAHVGASVLGAVLKSAGIEGLLAIAAFHLLETTAMGFAWWRLSRSGGPWTFVWGRLLRDAGVDMLAFSQIGGSIMAVRLVVLRGVGSALAAATLLADTTIEFGAQIVFVALGVLMMRHLAPGALSSTPVLIALGLALPAAAAFIAVQLRASELLARLPQRPGAGRLRAMLVKAATVHAELHEIYRPSRVAPSFALHLVAWLLAPVEAWLAFRLMGARLDFAVVFALESLVFAARAMAFLVPGAIGVQEGAYVLLCTALGIPPALGLGLSMLKRGRDLTLGIPTVLSWQSLEIGRRSPRA